MKWDRRQLLLPLIFFTFYLQGWSVRPTPAEGVRVICTTTLIESAVKAIGEDHVSVTTIIPFRVCPGHFDLTPKEMAQIKTGDLFVAHGFEQFLQKLARDLGSDVPIVRVSVQENWMTPSAYREAVKNICDILCAHAPHLSEFFRQNANRYNVVIVREEERIRREFAPLQALPVVCSAKNASFLRWLGLNVVATFPSYEEISAKDLGEVVFAGKRRGARCVFDNLQSSGRVGRTIATELGVPLVMLSNFPAGQPPCYLLTLRENCLAIKSAFIERR